tara:strand:+ start:6328 stop:6753 length:426 start_codon:yes stop_codon:yes gene_type:complete
MTIEQILYERLIADGAVVDIVEDRVYPLHATQGEEVPYIVIQRNDSFRQHYMIGTTGLVTASATLRLLDTNHERLQDLGEAVRLALDSWRGEAGDSTVSRIWIDGDDENYTPPGDGGDHGVYYRDQLWFVVYSETATALPS